MGPSRQRVRGARRGLSLSFRVVLPPPRWLSMTLRGASEDSWP